MRDEAADSLVIGVIPARYGSTRFPGKLLADLAGKPVLQWTWERALEARSLDRLVIAAGDEKIAAAAREFTCESRLQSAASSNTCAEVVEVFEELPSGSDRVWLAYQKLRIAECGLRNESEMGNEQPTIIVNIQGDEPLLDPAVIDAVVGRLRSDPEAGVATAVTPIRTEEEYSDPSVVKVVMDESGRALYFSRAPIPYERENSSLIPHPSSLRHIGLYAYRAEVLKHFTELPPSPLEQTERLEQLRLLEQGVKFAVAVVEQAGMGVDTEGDLERVRGSLD